MDDRLFTFSSGITWVLRKPSSLVSVDTAPLGPEAETPASPKESETELLLAETPSRASYPKAPAPAPDEAQLLSAALTIEFAGKEHALWVREANSAPPCGQCRKCRPRLPHRSLEAACPTDRTAESMKLEIQTKMESLSQNFLKAVKEQVIGNHWE